MAPVTRPRASELIRTLELAPHPEGGFYLRDDACAAAGLRGAAPDLATLL